MLKRVFVVAFLASFLMASGAPVYAQAKALSIAVVDVEKVLSEAKAAKSLQSQILAKKETLQKEFSAKEKELKATETTLLGEKETLPAEEFAKKRKAYEEKIIETRKLFQKTRNSMEEGVGEAMKQLRKSILEAAADVGQEKGYDIVLTRESVLLADKSLDITAEVLAKLDAKLADIKLQVK